MATAINIADQNLYYRVSHPEFNKRIAYKAIAYIDYGESAWSKLLFINERGMTYGVKVKRCDCINSYYMDIRTPLVAFGTNYPTHEVILSEELINRPFPKPSCVNPDLEED